jgi:aminoglycoside phosphotransferase (APT) family kinase protein
VPMSAASLDGEEAVTLAAEVHRWDRALTTVDDDLSRGHGECAARLLAHLPEAVAPTLCHGDWRLGNMLCSGSSIAAVIDWEIWSVADPRVDLAWFLAATVTEGNVFAVREVPGMPSRERLLAEYESVLGRSVGDLEWFAALNDLKACAAMGLILKRNRRQPEPDPTVEAHAPRLAALIVRALDRLSAGKASP